MALENQQIHTINTDKIFLNNRNDKKTDHIVFETNGVLGENNVEFSNCNVDVKTGFLKAPEIRSNNLKDADGNTTITLSSSDIDFHSKTVNNLIVGTGATINAVAVTSANGYASLDAELDALQQQKISITGHTANKVFVSSSGGGLTTSSVTTTDLNKLPNITISAPLNLDTIESQQTTNTGNIATNTSNIATNVSATGINTSARITNTSLISTNQGNISTNTSNIATNTSNISNNVASIEYLDSEIIGNTYATGLNTTNIATNVTNIATNVSNIGTNTSNISNNTFKLSNITYSELSSSGNYGINGGDNGGISSVYPNGSINITGGYDGVNVNGIIVIKQDDAERIKITDDDTTFGSSTNKLIVDSVYVNTSTPGMEFLSDAFFLLKKTSATSHWGLIMDRGDEYWSAFRSSHHWDTYYNNLKYQLNSTGTTMYLNYYSHGNVSLCYFGGKVGIGAVAPKCLLHVGADTDYQTNDTGISSLNDMDSVSYLSVDTTQVQNASFFDFANTGTGYNLSIYAEGMIFTNTYVGASDRRIKKNITEIDDERSLIQLRNLPCVDYDYIDNFKNGEYKTIGFIAQDVKEIMPNCVKKVSDIIPNEMRKLENIEYEEVKDNEGTIKYKLLNQTLEECNYRFYVKKDASSNEIRIELEYPFLFNKKYEQVYCYGKRIDDFLAIDKNKIFAVAFSATQEIDRIQQQHAIEIVNVKAELTNIKAELVNIKEELQKEKNKTIYFEDKLRDIETTLKSLTN